MGRARGRPRIRKSRAPVQEEPEEEPEQAMEVEEEVEPEQVGEEVEEANEEDEEEEEEEEEEEKEKEDAKEQLWESFKEDHYETVEQLPLYLHRTHRLIRDLDVRNQAHQRDIQGLLRAYLECRRRAEPVEMKPEPETTNPENKEGEGEGEAPSNGSLVNGSGQQDAPMDDAQQGSSGATPESKGIPSPAEARGLLTRLAVLVDEWVQNCEEKVNLAKAAYDSTDRHVRILDAAFAEQSKGSFTSPESEHDPDQALGGEDYVDIEGHTPVPSQRQRKGRRRDNRKRSQSSASGTNKRKRGRPPTAEPGPSTSRKAPPVRRNKINMEILPSEPRYCVCQQVSYGDMVMCDNEHCPIEWFHLACVGLAQAPSPKTKWFCGDCTAALGPKARRRRR